MSEFGPFELWSRSFKLCLQAQQLSIPAAGSYADGPLVGSKYNHTVHSSSSSYFLAKAYVPPFTLSAELRCVVVLTHHQQLCVLSVNVPGLNQCNFNHINTVNVMNLASFAFWHALSAQETCPANLLLICP